jgi:hypothetical protein
MFHGAFVSSCELALVNCLAKFNTPGIPQEKYREPFLERATYIFLDSWRRTVLFRE